MGSKRVMPNGGPIAEIVTGSHPIDCLRGFFIIFLVARVRTWVQFCLFPLKWPLCHTDRDKTNLISSVLTQKTVYPEKTRVQTLQHFSKFQVFRSKWFSCCCCCIEETDTVCPPRDLSRLEIAFSFITSSTL